MLLFELVGSVRFLDGLSGGLFLFTALLSLLAFSCSGSSGFFLLSFLDFNRNTAAFLLLLPLLGWVENGPFRRGHITENNGDGGALLRNDGGLARFLIKNLSVEFDIGKGERIPTDVVVLGENNKLPRTFAIPSLYINAARSTKYKSKVRMLKMSSASLTSAGAAVPEGVTAFWLLAFCRWG